MPNFLCVYSDMNIAFLSLIGTSQFSKYCLKRFSSHENFVSSGKGNGISDVISWNLCEGMLLMFTASRRK